VIPIFVSKALKGEPITVAGDGQQFRQFIYVEDLAEGVVLALKPAAAGRLYNLDGEDRITILQIAETIQRLLGNAEIQRVPARPGDFSGKVVRGGLARKELGWKPETSFEEGLRRYIAWYQTRQQQQQKSWSKVDAALRS
jgi:UDP-glucose 4-epimerase